MEPLILGLPFDNGIRSMLHLGRGVIGAKDAPRFIFDLIDKEQLNIKKEILDLYKFNLELSDDENLKNEATNEAHKIVENEILKNKDKFLISIGGDHSLTYPIFKIISKEYKKFNKKISLLCLDAHFDMRSHLEEGIISSGNSFYRIINENLCDDITILGINKNNNEVFLKQLDFAKKNNVNIVFIEDLNKNKLNEVLLNLKNPIYLSIDIDILNEKYAPGVSARNLKGLSEKDLFDFIELIMRYDVIAIDIMETSSRIDDLDSLKKTSEVVVKIIKIIEKRLK